MSNLVRPTALCLLTIATLASALVSSAEAGCRYYGPGSTGCAHKAPPAMQQVRPQPNFNVNQPNQNYSYGRVWINPNTFRSGAGIIQNGARRQGAAWVAPTCRQIGAALVCG